MVRGAIQVIQQTRFSQNQSARTHSGYTLVVLRMRSDPLNRLLQRFGIKLLKHMLATNNSQTA